MTSDHWNVGDKISKHMRDEIRSVLSDRTPEQIDEPGLEDSSVILGVQERQSPHVVFVRRSGYRDEHADEMGLPGGRADPGDDFPTETALREYEEEVGVPPERIELLGRLDDVATPTGYRIVPFVGYLAPDAEYDPCETEVAGLYLVPLRELLDQYDPEDDRYEYEDAVIWGATGRIVASFLSILQATDAV